MAEQPETPNTQQRIQRNYLISIISNTLVLFILGVIGLLYINTQAISRHVKENLRISVFLKENVREANIQRLKKSLDSWPYIIQAEFIDKNEAASQLEEELGEDFTRFLGENPLPSSIDIHVQSTWANPDSIAVIKKQLANYHAVQDVYYHQDLVYLVHNNVRKISLFISIFAALLLIVTVALINNTVRLMIYAKRFAIHTMELVGATDGFIKKPFIIQSALQGSISAALAFAFLFGGVLLIEKELQGLIYFQGLATLFALLLATGVIISATSANFAVQRYLKMDTDKLYY